MRFAPLALFAAGLAFSATTHNPAQAGPVFDTFGALPEATFGGDGIPNDAVAISTVDIGGGVTATLGLTATERFFNPDVTNDGAGRFTAAAGLNNGFGSSSVLGAAWNIGFYIALSSGTFADLGPNTGFTLAYDLNPGFGRFTPGFLDILGAAASVGGLGTSVIQGSQNLAFDFLNGTPALPFVSSPSLQFDPNATGRYEIDLLAFAPGNEGPAGLSSIDVFVEVVPAPGALALVLGGLVLIGLRRRQA